MSSTTSSDISSAPQLTGKVKWFNNKAGFGFITICDGEQSGKDIFVHYSSIQVKNQQYKYLVQGEYVDFSLVKPENGDHDFHAVNVCGIKGGSLMCETRKQTYDERATRQVKPARDTTRDTTRETTREEVSADIKQKTTTRKSSAPKKAAPAEKTTTPRETTEGADTQGFKKVVRKQSAKSKTAAGEGKPPRKSAPRAESATA
jgi:CspA family cold shock protein